MDIQRTGRSKVKFNTPAVIEKHGDTEITRLVEVKLTRENVIELFRVFYSKGETKLNDILSAVEFGYKCKKKGMKLDDAKIKARKVYNGDGK